MSLAILPSKRGCWSPPAYTSCQMFLPCSLSGFPPQISLLQGGSSRDPHVNTRGLITLKAQGKYHHRERHSEIKQLWKSSFFRKWQEGASFPLGPSCQVFTAHCSHNIPALGCVSRPQARCSPWVPGGCCSPSVSVIWQQCQTALLSLLCGGVASNNFSPAAWLCASSIM